MRSQMSNELGRSSVHAQTQTDPKAPGSAVGALAAMEEPKLREEHHGETVQCSFSLKKKKIPPLHEGSGCHPNFISRNWTR